MGRGWIFKGKHIAGPSSGVKTILWESYTIVSILQLFSISCQGACWIYRTSRAYVVQFILSFQRLQKEKKLAKNVPFSWIE